MALSLGESRHSLGVTKDELECLKGYETGVSFQEVLRMIPHHPTENSKTEENGLPNSNHEFELSCSLNHACTATQHEQHDASGKFTFLP